MKVSDIIKNITEVQDSDWIRFMSEDELKQFKILWLADEIEENIRYGIDENYR